VVSRQSAHPGAGLPRRGVHNGRHSFYNKITVHYFSGNLDDIFGTGVMYRFQAFPEQMHGLLWGLSGEPGYFPDQGAGRHALGARVAESHVEKVGRGAGDQSGETD
jgi:hypothetical protein